jgi:hypothetical protein
LSLSLCLCVFLCLRLYRSLIPLKTLLRTVIHFDLPDECVAWVFQVLPPEGEETKEKENEKKTR